MKFKSKTLRFQNIVNKGKSLGGFEYSKIIYSSLVIGLFTIAFALLVQGLLPPEIPLFYGLALGQQQIADPILLVIPGSLATIITVINFFLFLIIKRVFLRQILIVSSLTVSLLCLITTVKIFLLVGIN